MATMRGDAASQDQKELTTKFPKHVEAVKGVTDEMTVAMTSKTARTSGRKIDNASITAQVKIALLYNLPANALHSKFETTGGVVSWYGKACSAAELKLATRLANDINGVQMVKNRMVIE
jgi:osmotically-inducible protein OsmY